MKRYMCKKYDADSGRGTGEEKVISVLLTSPEDLLKKEDNLVLNALDESEMSSSIGLYFYRFKDQEKPFIKIGECTRNEGISVRFQRGWHGTKTYGDTYLARKKGAVKVDSDFLIQINNITEDNPAYFVFYEHRLLYSHPKIDEVYAYRIHKHYYGCNTLSPERMNSNALLARKLIWHKSSFSEVCRFILPGGVKYCE